jgi:hypothetical protein
MSEKGTSCSLIPSSTADICLSRSPTYGDPSGVQERVNLLETGMSEKGTSASVPSSSMGEAKPDVFEVRGPLIPSIYACYIIYNSAVFKEKLISHSLIYRM